MLSLDNIDKSWSPPPKLTVSQWAEAKRRLSSESSAEPGRWRNKRTPYMVEIMDEVTNPEVEQISLKSSAQIGKTELMNNVCGYFIDMDPCSMLMVQPTESMAKSWVQERFDPMIRDTPCFEGVLTEDNLMHKSYIGGFLAVGYSKSAASLASRPIRVLGLDEVDRYDLKVKDEGDPANQAIKRTTTFHNRLILAVSTPKLKGSSRIDAFYDASDQRLFEVPCWHCNAMHFLTFDDIKFDRASPRESAIWTCPSCAKENEHRHKQAMLEAGKWRAQQPFVNHAGFHINELYSPWVTWGEVAASFLEAKKSEETLQTWVNLSMGMSFEPKSQKVDATALESLKEKYTADMLPCGVLVLRAGVDTQNDRFEVDVWGFGHGDETWFVEKRIILGDPKNAETREELDKYLLTTWAVEGRARRGLDAVFHDSGGQRTKEVYDFVRGKAGRRVFAIKGASQENPYDNTVEVNKQGYSKKYRCSLVVLHVSKLKLRFYNQLKATLETNSDPKKENSGPGYVHFPKDVDGEFFKSLTAEKLSRKTISGKHLYYWEVKEGCERNERLDNRVYAAATLLQFPPDYEKLAQKTAQNKAEKKVDTKKKATKSAKKKRNWVTKY